MTSATKPSLSWQTFLHSPSISYIPPPLYATAAASDASSCSSSKFYWNQELLQKWQSLLRSSLSSLIDEEFTSSSSAAAKATEEISYGSLLLLATYVADELRRRLQLLPSSTATTDVIDKLPSCDHDDNDNIRRIGMAIPEGPFLPLFVLVIHSLNIAVAERWLLLLDENNNSHDDNSATSASTAPKYCNGVVLIPMETDEAPQRYQSNQYVMRKSGKEVLMKSTKLSWKWH